MSGVLFAHLEPPHDPHTPRASRASDSFHRDARGRSLRNRGTRAAVVSGAGILSATRRRRARRRQRPRVRARRRPALVRRASHSCRRGRGHQHGRAHRRRLCHRHDPGENSRRCWPASTGTTMFGASRIPVQERAAEARRARLSVAPRVRPEERTGAAVRRSTTASRSTCCSRGSRRRITASATFDDLPTPFRCVAVDLKTARLGRARSRSLAQRACARRCRCRSSSRRSRSTTALLVDGGAMNNVPADVVRAMGADQRDCRERRRPDRSRTVNTSLLGLAGTTLDAMMRANTLQALTSADVVINVPLDRIRHRSTGGGSATSFANGYGAAEAMKAQLLPLSVDEAAWQQWVAARAAARRRRRCRRSSSSRSAARRRRTSIHPPRARARTSGSRSIPRRSTTTLTELGGLDRYESLRWDRA